MRHPVWITPLALAALVACAEGVDDTGAMSDEATAAAAAEDETAMATGVQLACAPTEGPEDLAQRASAYDSVSFAVGEGGAKICYGRPELRGRTMIGGEAVPYGQLWRFGANEPTIIHLDVAASIAGLSVEPGSYSLYAVPMEGDEWTLIVNRSTSQWGHERQYTEEVEAQEVGRAPVEAGTTEAPVESFTIRANPDGPGVVAEWQNSRVHIPVTPAG